MSLSTYKELQHLPGDKGLPIFGDFFRFLKDATKYYTEQREKYGDIFISNNLLGASVVLCGPAATKFLLVDQAKFTSNKEAWEVSLSDLFPNGLMLMDGVQHKYHRSIMLDAFKKNPMQGYLDMMPELIQGLLQPLQDKKKHLFFPFFKNVTLRISAKVFFGLNINDDLTEVNKAVTDIVSASAALPINLPFTTYRKGIQGRQYLISFFKSIMQERRKNPGKDLFSKLCLAEDEAGNQFTDQEIIDHLIFILMASHDTTAITLTLMSYFLAKHPEWQERIRGEIKEVNLQTPFLVKDLRQLEKLGFVMKETLRLHPPLILVTRKLEKEMVLDDMRLPKNAAVNVVMQMTHLDERTWTNPTKFDPERFNKERKEQTKCPFSYAPFGAGPHHCIGYGFAEMSVKMVMMELLKQYRLSVPEGYNCKIKDVPLKQPTDNLPMFIERIV